MAKPSSFYNSLDSPPLFINPPSRYESTDVQAVLIYYDSCGFYTAFQDIFAAFPSYYLEAQALLGKQIALDCSVIALPYPLSSPVKRLFYRILLSAPYVPSSAENAFYLVRQVASDDDHDDLLKPCPIFVSLCLSS